MFEGSALTVMVDREWLDTINAERKKEQLDPVSYEFFEVVMDRLEKEWFDLVHLTDLSVSALYLPLYAIDETSTETRNRAPFRRFNMRNM